jgi:hypothetical protein
MSGRAAAARQGAALPRQKLAPIQAEGGKQRRKALTPAELNEAAAELKKAALAERRVREAAEGVGPGELSRGNGQPSKKKKEETPDKGTRYWKGAKTGDYKLAPVPEHNAWRRPRGPAAVGQSRNDDDVNANPQLIQLAQKYGKKVKEMLTICFESLLQYMITEVSDSSDNAKSNEELAYNLFEYLHAKDTRYDASKLPTNIIQRAKMLKQMLNDRNMSNLMQIDRELAEARNNGNEEATKNLMEEKGHYEVEHDTIRMLTSSEYLQHCWNVVNDPELVFTGDDDQNLLSLFTGIMQDPPTLQQLPQVKQGKQVNSRRQQDPVWRPPPERERRGAPSAASEAFLGTQRAVYTNTLNGDLTAALNQAGDQDKYKAVYVAFRDAFVRMLVETRKHCFGGWMQQQAAQDITKAQWLAVLKESNALWHAVVLEFRRMYEALNLSGKFQEIVVYEAAQYEDGTPIPTHHISDMHILLTRAQSDVARGRWRTFVRKEFAENTEHFVREYQKLLMQRYEQVKSSLFGFWFYPSDLCRWVKDLQEMATLPGAASLADTRDSRNKRFRWPACCRKGESMADGSADSRAYFTFCRLNRLPFDDPRSRLQFCMRMRAAWLRVVACYEIPKDGAPPTEAQIERYLEEQHVYEISLFKKDNGASDWKVEPRHVLLWPQKFDFQRLRNDDISDRRVLVYGAPMRCAGAAANPYLCASSLQ